MRKDTIGGTNFGIQVQVPGYGNLYWRNSAWVLVLDAPTSKACAHLKAWLAHTDGAKVTDAERDTMELVFLEAERLSKALESEVHVEAAEVVS